MTRLKIKPLSLNNAYRGRRFTTPELLAYKEILRHRLPKLTLPEGKLWARYRFGVSSKAADVDNLVKCFQDALATKYLFKDNKVYRIFIEKEDVDKGEEYVEFEFGSY